jgi:ABC-type transport system substrate-binding protein
MQNEGAKRVTSVGKGIWVSKFKFSDEAGEKGGKEMKGKSKVTIGLITSIALLLIALPLLGVCAEPKPQGTLNIALASLAEEGFLSPVGESAQARVWPLVFEYPFYLNEKTQKPMPGLAKRMEYSKDGLTLTMYLRKGVQ